MFKPIQGQKPIQVSDPDKEYHGYKSEIKKGDPAFVMSRSELWKFFQNAHKWLYSEKEEATDPMAFGSLVDCLLLTPDQFEKRYAIEPETYPSDKGETKKWTYSANFCKEWRSEQQGAGKLGVSKADISEAQAAVKSYLGRGRLMDFHGVSATQSMALVEWHDDTAGLVIPFRLMLDLVPAPKSDFGDTLADLKTCADAERGKWVREVFKRGYYFQAGVYLDGYNAASGLDYKLFENHLIESSAPYEVTHRRISEDFIAIGRMHYQAALRNYCQCLKSGYWPGYDTDVVEPESWMVGG